MGKYRTLGFYSVSGWSLNEIALCNLLLSGTEKRAQSLRQDKLIRGLYISPLTRVI